MLLLSFNVASCCYQFHVLLLIDINRRNGSVSASVWQSLALHLLWWSYNASRGLALSLLSTIFLWLQQQQATGVSRMFYTAVYNLFVTTKLRLPNWPSVLWRCGLGSRKGIQPVKNWVVGCWRGYLSGARCRLAYGPADATVSCFNKIQIGFTFLVPAHPGSPGQRAVKWCVYQT